MTAAIRTSEAPAAGGETIDLLVEELTTHVLRDGAPAEEPVTIRRLAYYQALPDLSRIDDALRYGMLRYPFVLMYHSGRPAPIGSYLENRFCDGERVPGFADYDRIVAQLKQGHSLEIAGLQYWDRSCAHVSAALGRRLGLAVDAQAFVTPPGRRATDIRRDHCSVLAVQLSGRKRWQIHEKPVTADWRAGVADDPCALRFDAVLSPGDGLYFPPGCAYHAVAEPDNASYHITLGLRQTSLLGAAGQLARTMSALPSARDTPFDDATTAALTHRLLIEFAGVDVDRVAKEAYRATQRRSDLRGERLLMGWVDGLAAAAARAAASEG